MSVGPIPWRDIIGFIEFYQIRDHEMFLGIIRRMDNEYLRMISEETKKEGK